MGVQEQLSAVAVGADPPIATEHVHRYRLAASLCAEMRVADLGGETGYGTAILREAAASVTTLDDEADAVEFLASDLTDRFDAIVFVAGTDLLSERAAALEHLGRHASAGLKMVLSFPTEPGAFEGFDDATLLYQFLADGSLIRGEGSTVATPATFPGNVEPESADHFILCVNLDARLQELGGWLELQLDAVPGYGRRIRDLERANRKLWLENARIGRARIGMGGSAAVMAGERVRQLEERVRELEGMLASPRHRWVEDARHRIRSQSLLDRTARSLGAWLSR